MVAVRRHKSCGTFNLRVRHVIFCIILAILLASFIDPVQNNGLGQPFSSIDNHVIDSLDTDTGVAAMKSWRTRLSSSCQQILSTANGNITDLHLQEKERVEADALRSIVTPDANDLASSMPDRSTPSSLYKSSCKHVFIDLGTNRGDSIAYAVDAALDVCSPMFLEADFSIKQAYRTGLEFPHPHLDENDLKVHGKGYKAFGILYMLQKYFHRQHQNGNSGMEEVCVYGMEGNPYFTKHLKLLEAVVNGMKPRPLRHLHIHTETVVAPKDGPTILYLDRISENNHFWGSSLLPSMADIKKTTRQNNGTSIKAQVDGMTLSTLLQRSLMANGNLLRDTDTGTGISTGGSVLVKIDVEGAEYSILKELESNGWICDYVRMGNNATMVVEYHHHLIRDADEKRIAMDGLKAARGRLKACGVQFKRLPAFWTD